MLTRWQLFNIERFWNHVTLSHPVTMKYFFVDNERQIHNLYGYSQLTLILQLLLRIFCRQEVGMAVSIS